MAAETPQGEMGLTGLRLKSVLSHALVQGACPHPRRLRAGLRGCVRSGLQVCVGFCAYACDPVHANHAKS